MHSIVLHIIQVKGGRDVLPSPQLCHRTEPRGNVEEKGWSGSWTNLGFW